MTRRLFGGGTSRVSISIEPQQPSRSAVMDTSITGAVLMSTPHAQVAGLARCSLPQVQRKYGPGSFAMKEASIA